jgi:hypothetical protein
MEPAKKYYPANHTTKPFLIETCLPGGIIILPRLAVTAGTEGRTANLTGPKFVVTCKAGQHSDLQGIATKIQTAPRRQPTGHMRNRKPVTGDLSEPTYKINLAPFYLPVQADLGIQHGEATEYEIDLTFASPEEWSTIAKINPVLTMTSLAAATSHAVPYGAVQCMSDQDQTITFYQNATALDPKVVRGGSWYPIGDFAAYVDAKFRVSVAGSQVDFEIQLPG